MFDDATTAALELADAMCADTSAISDELIEELRFHYGEVERAELLLVCGQANLNNRVGNLAKRVLGE